MELEAAGYIYTISTENLSNILMFIIIWTILLGLGTWVSGFFSIKN